MDYLLTYDDSTLPPLHAKASFGRPLYSRDKGRRPSRAAVIPADDEAVCMATLSVIMLHVRSETRNGGGWFVDSIIFDIFRATEASQSLHQWRTTPLTAMAQLRRWVPFCRQLVLATEAFESAFSFERSVAAFGPIRKSPKWVQDRAERVQRLVHGWMRGGMLATQLFTHAQSGTTLPLLLDKNCILPFYCRFFHMRVGQSMAHISIQCIHTRVCLILRRSL